MYGLTNILLVEDNNIDALALKRSLRSIDSEIRVTHVCNGQEAMDLLTSDLHPRPSLILLDLNMPVMGGLEFLSVFKKNPKNMPVPVVVLTTSMYDKDVSQAYQTGACGYFVKSMDFQKSTEIVESIVKYWTKSELLH